MLYGLYTVICISLFISANDEVNRLAIFPFVVKNANDQQIATIIIQTTTAYIQQREWYSVVPDAQINQALQKAKIKPQEIIQILKKGELGKFNYLCDYAILGEIIPQTPTADVEFIVSLQFIRISDNNVHQSLSLPTTRSKVRETANLITQKIFPLPNDICIEIQKLHNVAMKKKDWQQIILLANWYIKINSQTHIPYYNRALAYEELMYLPEALQDYQTALQLATNEQAVEQSKAALVRIKPKLEEMVVDRGKLLAMIDQLLKPLMQNKQTNIMLYPEVIQDIKKIAPSSELDELYKDALELKRDLPDILQELRTAHAAKGSNQILVNLVQKAEQYEKKRSSVETTLATKFSNMDVIYIDLALIAQKESRFEAALLAMDKGLIVAPSSARLYYLKGMIFMSAQDFNKAVEWFSTAIENDAKYTPAYFQRGCAYSALGQFDKALPNFQKAATLDPKSPQTNYSLGEVLAELKLDAKALVAYNKAIALNSKYSAAYFERGKIYDRQMLYLYALKDYQKAGELSSAMQAKAAQHIIKVKEYLLKDADIYIEKGIQETENGNVTLAITFLNTALQYNPKNAEAYFRRGICLQMQNEHTKALEDFKLAFQLETPKDRWYYQRAISYQQLNRFDSALNDLQTAVQMNSAFHLAYQQRGQIFEKQKNYTQALRNYETAIQIFPTKASYYMDAARVAIILGKHEQGQNYMIRGRQYLK